MKKTVSIFAKIFKVLTYIVTALVIAVTIFVLYVTMISNTENWSFKAFTVLSDSMKDTFEAGDIVIVENVDIDTLTTGDIIAFYSIDPYTEGEIFTHKIREKTTYDGQKAFTTYGTTTDVNDPYPAVSENIIGKMIFSIGNIGDFIEDIKSNNALIYLVVIIILLLIIFEAKNLVNILRNKNMVEVRTEDEEDISIDEEKDEQKDEKKDSAKTKIGKTRFFSSKNKINCVKKEKSNYQAKRYKK